MLLAISQVGVSSVANIVSLSFGSNDFGRTGQGTVIGDTLVATPIITTNLAGLRVTEFSVGDQHSLLVAVPHLQGDYDFDGDVDTLDYDKWRSKFGTTSFMSDGNDDGIVDAADYVVWRKHLGMMPAATSSESKGVPEPSSIVLLVIAASIAFFRMRNA
jgi:hypothetical protein